MRACLARRSAIGAVLGLIAWLAGVPAAHADSLPSDPNAHGYIGLCDGHGHNVTAGYVDAKPFVWTAVSSTPASATMQGPGENTVLSINQPRSGVEPEEWSGDELTATSFYSKRSAPAAQATRADLSLATIIKEFPPQEDGLYELRMYYGRLDHGTYGATYPATFIQVSGNTWHVVKGGTVDCTDPGGISNEVATGVVPKAEQVPPPPVGPISTGGGGGTSTAVVAGSTAGGVAVLAAVIAAFVLRSRRRPARQARVT